MKIDIQQMDEGVKVIDSQTNKVDMVTLDKQNFFLTRIAYRGRSLKFGTSNSQNYFVRHFELLDN